MSRAAGAIRAGHLRYPSTSPASLRAASVYSLASLLAAPPGIDDATRKESRRLRMLVHLL